MSMRRRNSNDQPQTWRIGAWWNCFKSPTPTRIIKICSCKSSIWRFTLSFLSNSCHWFSLMRVFQINQQVSVRKAVFWKPARAFFGLYTKTGICILHLGKTHFFKYMILVVVYSLILFVFEGAPSTSSWNIICCLLSVNYGVASTKFVRKLLHVREFWLQFSRLSHFIYPDFFDITMRVSRHTMPYEMFQGPAVLQTWLVQAQHGLTNMVEESTSPSTVTVTLTERERFLLKLWNSLLGVDSGDHLQSGRMQWQWQ